MNTLSTADRFADEMNTQRVLQERALDDEHARDLTGLLELQNAQIVARYGIGSTLSNLDAAGELRVFFIDQSFAVRDRSGRWITP